MREASTKKIGMIIIGGTIGNLTEWYNFLLYGYLASVISELFFPSQNKLLSLTLAFTIFALSFFVRPFGGILLGWIGDTYGRQRALILSLVMMGIPTFLISCLPTYDQIGVWSPILLCIFRICQGLSAGGEHTGSAVYLAEYAPPAKRSLWISIVPSSAALGILFSSTVALFIVNIFTPEQLIAWGWRTGYWLGTLLCLISILFRVALPETPIFQKIQKEKGQKRYSISVLIKDLAARKKLLILIALASAQGIFYQMLFIWMPTYLTHFQHLDHHLALQINSLFIFCLACLTVCVGYFADRIQRKSLLSLSCILMLFLAYPLFSMLSANDLWQIYIAMGIFTLIFSIYLPIAFAIMVELFEPKIRYTGFSFGFNLGIAIFGGTCPLIATWLIELTKNTSAPAFYMMLASVFALFTSTYVLEKRGRAI